MSVLEELSKGKLKRYQTDPLVQIAFGQKQVVASGVGEVFTHFTENCESNRRELLFVADFITFFLKKGRLNEKGIFLENGNVRKVNIATKFFMNYYQNQELIDQRKEQFKKGANKIRLHNQPEKEVTLNSDKDFFREKLKHEAVLKHRDEFLQLHRASQRRLELENRRKQRLKSFNDSKSSFKTLFTAKKKMSKYNEEFYFRDVDPAKMRATDILEYLCPVRPIFAETSDAGRSASNRTSFNTDMSSNGSVVTEDDVERRFNLNDICSLFKNLLIRMDEQLIPTYDVRQFLQLYKDYRTSSKYDASTFKKQVYEQITGMLFPNNFYMCYIIHFLREVVDRRNVNWVDSRNIAVSFGPILFKDYTESVQQEMDNLEDKIHLLVFLIDSEVKLPYSKKRGKKVEEEAADPETKSRLRRKTSNFSDNVEWAKYKLVINNGAYSGQEVLVSGVLVDCFEYLAARKDFLNDKDLFESECDPAMLLAARLKIKTRFFQFGPYDLLKDMELIQGGKKPPKNVQAGRVVASIVKLYLELLPQKLIPLKIYQKQLKYLYVNWREKKISSRDSKLALNLFVLDAISAQNRANLCIVLDFLSRLLNFNEKNEYTIVKLSKIFTELVIEFPKEEVGFAEEIFCFLLFRYNSLKKLLMKENKDITFNKKCLFGSQGLAVGAHESGRFQKMSVATLDEADGRRISLLNL